ncbi:hypothetical protein COO60DRAFT_1520713 [Scenedesmus sp. NREL 46B-D3]|nr:hypothetical protein COO60DRAFT_1520713 [Scenedesmus sp. NREL 46B-D3]
MERMSSSSSKGGGGCSRQPVALPYTAQSGTALVTMSLLPPCRLMASGGYSLPAAKQHMLKLVTATAVAPAPAEVLLLQQLLQCTVFYTLDESSLSSAEVLQILHTLPLPPVDVHQMLLHTSYLERRHHHHHITHSSIASAPSAPRPTGRKEEGALLQNVCMHCAHPKT